MQSRTVSIPFLVPGFLFLAAFCFPLGLVLPLMRLEKLFFFEETPSLLAIVGGLFGAGDWILALLVGTFSFLFPAAKLLLLFMIAFGALPRRRLKLLSALGKWSMMDVMLVALVIFAAKTSGVASALALPGLWFFTAAALFSAMATTFIRRSRQPA